MKERSSVGGKQLPVSGGLFFVCASYPCGGHNGILGRDECLGRHVFAARRGRGAVWMGASALCLEPSRRQLSAEHTRAFSGTGSGKMPKGSGMDLAAGLKRKQARAPCKAAASRAAWQRKETSLLVVVTAGIAFLYM